MATWATSAERQIGAVVPLPTLWALAQHWYHDRLAPGWRRRSTAEAQAIFNAVGLTDDFWRREP